MGGKPVRKYITKDKEQGGLPRPTPIAPDVWLEMPDHVRRKVHLEWTKQMEEEDKLLKIQGLDRDVATPDELAAAAVGSKTWKGGSKKPLSYKPIIHYMDEWENDRGNERILDSARCIQDPIWMRPLPFHWFRDNKVDIQTTFYYRDKDDNIQKYVREDRETTTFQVPGADGPEWKRVFKRSTQRLDPIKPNRTLVECCCGPNSRLGRTKLKPRDTRVVRITEDDDMTTEKGLKKTCDAVKDTNALLWGSLPCTGGSPWQHLNKKKPGGMKRYRDHVRAWKKMFDNFAIAARTCHKHGGNVAIEWPSNCAYWKEARVMALVHELGLKFAKFHGCAVGLVSQPGGLPITKPWTIATNHENLFSAFDGRFCPGPKVHPVHQTCEGKHTKRTEEYTDLFARMVHSAHRQGPKLPKQQSARDSWYNRKHEPISHYTDNHNPKDPIWHQELPKSWLGRKGTANILTHLHYTDAAGNSQIWTRTDCGSKTFRTTNSKDHVGRMLRTESQSS